MAVDRLSYCRICAAACGIVVTVDDERVQRVRGDPAHPVSRGYVCSKGRGIPAWHHDPARLDHPRLRGRDATWQTVLDDLAATMRHSVSEQGADAIALYLATGLAYDAGGQISAGMWMGALGSTAFYSAATVDNAPVLVAAELVAGNAMLNPVWDPSSPGLLLLVGTNPVVSHGYGTTLPDPVRYLREYRRHGGRVWVLDPRRTETASMADEHVAVRPGADVAVLGALVADLLGRPDVAVADCSSADIDILREAVAPFTMERAAHEAGVDETTLRRLTVQLREHHGRVAVFCGTGVTMARDGVVAEWLRWVLLIVTESLDRPGGMRFNRAAVNRLRPPRTSASPRPPAPGPGSRPELPRVVNQLPAVALADEIDAGHVRVLVVTGGNPLSAFPDPDRLRRSLAGLDALVVVDVADNELCAIATHVLPATGQLERADLSLAEHVALRSGLQATRPVVDAVADRKPVWWILASLAHRLGFDILAGADPDELDDERFLAGVLSHSALAGVDVFGAGPHGVDVPVEHGWVRETMLRDGRWNVVPPVMVTRLAAHTPVSARLVLVPRRHMAWSNSVRYGADDGPRTATVLRLNPLDATAAAIADSGAVTVTSEHGSLTGAAMLDEGVRPGVVSMTHGRLERSPGRLTSAVADVDPLTTMPLASGLTVTIAAADAEALGPTA